MRRQLSDEQVARYERDGVVFPVGALGADQAAAARMRFEEVARLLGDNPSAVRFGQWHLFFRWAYGLVTNRAVLDAVEDILGPDLLVHSSTVFAKPPKSPRFISWHQDGHYIGLDPPLWTSAWIALSESDARNGAMRVLPGSHRNGALPHVERPDPNNILRRGLSVDMPVDETAAVDVELKAGEMSLHHLHLVHGSNPNLADRPRIGFAIRYIAPAARQARAHHPVVLARGHDPFGHFEQMKHPPDGSIEDGLAAQQTLGRWIERL
jgi:non-haem Fe2+, alpha-ketoglutarate-dependent halogenase